MYNLMWVKKKKKERKTSTKEENPLFFLLLLSLSFCFRLCERVPCVVTFL